MPSFESALVYAPKIEAVNALPHGKMVLCPPGRFVMGASLAERDAVVAESVRAGHAKEEVEEEYRGEMQHHTELTHGFWMLQTPVTQAQFKALMGYNPSYFQYAGDEAPVEQVSWHMAAAFSNALSKKDGLDAFYEHVSGEGKKVEFRVRAKYKGDGCYKCNGWRLPTEAEWEYAARAGTTTVTYAGDLDLQGFNHSPTLHPIAWYRGNSGVSYEGGFDSSQWPEMQIPAARSGTHPVAQKEPNAWLLYDMLGSVWEWCLDWHAPFSQFSVVDPVGPSTGLERVVRGGAWYSVARGVRAAMRDWVEPSERKGGLGFRVLRVDLSKN